MARQKELNFFYQKKTRGNWNKGFEWYRSHFVGSAKIYGETSPGYTNFPKFTDVPSRMYSLVPNAKLIYLLREPVERIISHYVQFYADGKENLDFESALADFSDNRYLRFSRYFFQLQQYLAWYPPSNILVVSSEQLFNYPQATMKRIFQFLEVDTEFEFNFNLKTNARDILIFGSNILKPKFKFDTKLHDSSLKRRMTIAPESPTAKTLSAIVQLLPLEIGYHAKRLLYLPFSQPVKRPQISDALRYRIRDYLNDDIEQLKAFTGFSFPEWD